MAKKQAERKLTTSEKKDIQSAIEVAAVDCTPDKEWLIVVRVGTDAFPADVEDLRVTLNHINRLREKGYIHDDMKIVVVPHTLQFTRESLRDIELIVSGEGAND
jgi:hypothetical protein